MQTPKKQSPLQIKDLSKALNQTVNIYATHKAYSPANLYDYDYRITPTEIPEDSLAYINDKVIIKYSFSARLLQGIHDAYLEKFQDLIYGQALTHTPFDETESLELIPDYIYQLIQMGAILYEGYNDTLEDILSILHNVNTINVDDIINCIPNNAIQEAIKDLNRLNNYPF